MGRRIASNDPRRDGRRHRTARASVSAVLAIGAVIAVIAVWLYAAADPGGTTTGRRPTSSRGDPAPPPGAGVFDLTGLTVPEDQLLSGGPPVDGIPALTTARANPSADRSTPEGRRLYGSTAPVFRRQVRDIGLPGDARVIGLQVGGDARAFPLAILNQHEVVNDVVGGVPVAIVYCPLCDSVTVVDRRIDDQTLEFGVSGLLYQSNVVMYDRQSRSLWSQVKMQAISGRFAGRSLRHLGRWEIATLDDWVQRHPTGDVLSTQTGFRRDYARDPYAGYAESDRLWFSVTAHDARLGVKQPIIGVRASDGAARAYPVERVVEAGRLQESWAGGRVVLEAEGGPAPGVRIVELPPGSRAIHTYWFAWSNVQPQTSVYEPDAAEDER